VNGVPFLIDERTSLITKPNIKEANVTESPLPSLVGWIKNVVNFITPSRSLNFVSKRNYSEIRNALNKSKDMSTVLVLGGAVLGNGMDELLKSDSIELTETDVYLGERNTIICDAQSIPYEDKTFDCVIIQAVLEFIPDAERCVNEIARVLKDDGLVYSETPFMQQMVDFPDLFRYSSIGHQLLFRQFQCLKSGSVAGPGTVLNWSWEFFWCSLSNNRHLIWILRRFARITGFWFKYIDYFVIEKQEAALGASGYFLLARKTTKVRTLKEIVDQFR
jgi:SAM-dependent methyltransferase